ncbi:DNA-binding transcriptional regulator, LysR family [Cohaesibacter sp. ES.047]|uniref:transcriptional regulator GcvA n=1 Tax=Cohaesibacter sp. ES.047 TaxID=1798205 RepID=UPI000BB90A9F|nr:transcriptional regulator GcvA [Cohaesibacter sp. ES.047]SNY90772.1 DNA-binding transcriptional regulator, LysR family [Cohaesibacter sp. ES.047]
MLNYLPSLSALRAFEAAARHLSFTKAANELGVTQSAISRQMRTMEEQLGLRLFERTGAGLVLTEAGGVYAQKIRSKLQDIETATLELLAYRGQGGELTIACLPTLGARWLVPRLTKFTTAHPEVLIHLITKIEPFEFADKEIDAAFHFGEGSWAGALTDVLMPEYIVPLGHPDLLTEKDAIGLQALLLKYPLLQASSRPNFWIHWLRETEFEHPSPHAGPRFEHFHMVIRAAASKMGIALLPRFLVEDEILAGNLVPLHDRFVRSSGDYYFAYPQAKRANPNLQTFRTWVMREAQITKKEQNKAAMA